MQLPWRNWQEAVSDILWAGFLGLVATGTWILSMLAIARWWK